MKRIFVCLLVLMVCLSLCACGNDAAMEKYKEYEALIGYLESGDYESAYRELDRLTGKKDNGEEKAILGNWISTGAYEITFREDGTVEVYGAGRKIDGTWAYSSDLGCYTIATTQGNYSAFLKEEENITYVECFGAKLYGREVFETKMKPKLETARQEMEEKIASGVKIELGTEYTVGKAAVSLDLVLEEGDLWVYATVTNHSTESIEQIGGEQCPLYVGFKTEVYEYGQWSTIRMGIEVDFAFVDEKTAIQPGKTAVLKAKLCSRVGKMLENYGVVLGYAICSIGEENYYLDFSDYKK